MKEKRNWALEFQRFAESQAAANRADIAVRAAEFSRQFGAEGPDFNSAAIQQSEEATQKLQLLFSTTAQREAEEVSTCSVSGLPMTTVLNSFTFSFILSILIVS